MKRAIVNGMLFHPEKQAFESGWALLWQDQHIVDILRKEDVPADVMKIDAQGACITAGLIDTCTQLGLKEAGIRWEGDDVSEISQPVQEDLQVIDGIYPFDPGFAEARANGVTTVHVVPGPDTVIGGKSAIIRTNGTVMDEMIIQATHTYCVSLGERPKRTNRERFQAPFTRMKIAAFIREKLLKAKYEEQYGSLWHAILAKEVPLYIRANRADDMMTAVRLQQEFEINIVLVHATEAEIVLDRLPKENFTICLGPQFLDRARYELKNLSTKTAIKLFEANLPFVMTTDHPTSTIRNIGLEGLLAIREGLPYEQAILALTKGPAELLGLKAMGTLEQGKQADFVLWDGLPFAPTTSVKATYMAGEMVYEKGGNLV